MKLHAWILELNNLIYTRKVEYFRLTQRDISRDVLLTTYLCSRDIIEPLKYIHVPLFAIYLSCRDIRHECIKQVT